MDKIQVKNIMKGISQGRLQTFSILKLEKLSSETKPPRSGYDSLQIFTDQIIF
jgi:hypothetical protein